MRLPISRICLAAIAAVLVCATPAGNDGAEGRISLTVAMSGRFTGPGQAEGTFQARSLISQSTISPAVACHSGTVGWVGSRSG